MGDGTVGYEEQRHIQRIVVEYLKALGISIDLPTKRITILNNSTVQWKLNMNETHYSYGIQYFSSGEMYIVNLPAADPHVVGKLWNNAGVVTISAG